VKGNFFQSPPAFYGNSSPTPPKETGNVIKIFYFFDGFSSKFNKKEAKNRLLKIIFCIKTA